MERKIGEIFEYNGEWYQVVECSEDNYPCIGCCGCKGVGGARINGGECNGNARNDRKFVIFKKLEKVGEPFMYEKRTCQTYKLHTLTALKMQPDEVRSISVDKGNYTADIEIKQTKEDMEEKKLNLKPFDIQKAREGKPVCTRDGRKARIICFDRDWDMHIVALVSDPLGESVHYYLSNGKVDFDKQNDEDLMMLPEKKEGWVNVYYDNATSSHRSCRFIYDTKEQAVERAGSNYITTIKIEWEE